MRHIAACFALLPLTLLAQQVHVVHVGGSTSGGPLPYYTPQHLTITVGDTVRWVRDTGTHNVDGRTSSFPANPVSFYSGTPSGTIWPFQFTFTVPGVYNYHCTQQGHSATQFGSITVQSDTNVEEQEGDAGVLLFPVPTTDDLMVEFDGMALRSVEVFAMDGRKVLEPQARGTGRLLIPASTLANGQYVLRLIDDQGNVHTHVFRTD
jgi:plastocyanin